MAEVRLKGSYTIEATYVLAIVFLALVTMIQAAYRIHDRTAGAMALHEMVDRARHEPDADLGLISEAGEGRMSVRRSFPQYRITLERGGNEITGEHISGIGNGGSWRKEIESSCFRPHCFLRKVTLVESLEE